MLLVVLEARGVQVNSREGNRKGRLSIVNRRRNLLYRTSQTVVLVEVRAAGLMRANDLLRLAQFRDLLGKGKGTGFEWRRKTAVV